MKGPRIVVWTVLGILGTLLVIAGCPPITVTSPVTVTLDAVPTSGAAPLQVSFTGSATTSEAGRTITQYVLSFGDGTADLTSATAPSNVPHTYAAPANYTATLTVTDSGGATGSRSVTIQVTSATAGLPLATNPQAASAESTQAVQELFAGPPSGSADVNQDVQTFEGLVQTNPNDGGAQLGLALAQIAQSVDQASTNVNFNPYVYVPAQPGSLMQLRQILQRRNRLAEPLARILDLAFARGSASVASVRQQQEGPTPEQVQEVIRALLLPIIGGGGLPTTIVGAIERLQPLVNFDGILVSITVTDPETQVQQTVNIYGADIEIVEAILWWLRGSLVGLISRDLDPRGFNFDRKPQEMDTNGDGQLTTDEYLPGGAFLTLLPGISGYPAGGQLMQYAGDSFDTALQRLSDAVSRIVAVNDPNGLIPPPENPQEVLAHLSDLRLLLGGPQTVQLTLLNMTTQQTETRSLAVNFSAPFNRAVNDLRTLAPVLQLTPVPGSIDQDAIPVSFPDLTFGGLFPSPGLPQDLITGEFQLIGLVYRSFVLEPPTAGGPSPA